MLAMTIILDGDGAWPDLDGKHVVHLGNDALPIQVAALSGGMESDRVSVAIRRDLPDGSVVVAETSAELFISAARLIAGRWGLE
jgi:hypothetical protein